MEHLEGCYLVNLISLADAIRGMVKGTILKMKSLYVPIVFSATLLFIELFFVSVTLV